MANSKPSLDHQTQRAHDRLDERFGAVAFRRLRRHDGPGDAADEAGGFLAVGASAEFVRWIHWIAVPVASTSEIGHRGDADLGTLERHPLADADDQRERDARDRGR